MDEEQAARVRTAANRVMELADEVEARGYVTADGAALENARAVLHEWVDSVTGIVNTPALGRVTLIHAKGRESTITSPTLPFEIGAQADKAGR